MRLDVRFYLQASSYDIVLPYWYSNQLFPDFNLKISSGKIQRQIKLAAFAFKNIPLTALLRSQLFYSSRELLLF